MVPNACKLVFNVYKNSAPEKVQIFKEFNDSVYNIFVQISFKTLLKATGLRSDCVQLDGGLEIMYFR